MNIADKVTLNNPQYLYSAMKFTSTAKQTKNELGAFHAVINAIQSVRMRK